MVLALVDITGSMRFSRQELQGMPACEETCVNITSRARVESWTLNSVQLVHIASSAFDLKNTWFVRTRDADTLRTSPARRFKAAQGQREKKEIP
jgi:hypothetical protein